MALSSLPRNGTVPVSDNLFLWYEIQGDGEDLLVVPSASWLNRDLDPLIEGRTVVFYDVRGRGRSANIQDEALLGIHRDVDDLERLRVALGMERFDLFGWSYHGGIAARYALAYPEHVRRVVLIGPTGPRRDPYFDDFLGRFAFRVDVDGLQALQQKREAGLKESDPLTWCKEVHRLYLLSYVKEPENYDRMKSCPCQEPNMDPDHVNNQGRRAVEVLGPYDWREDFRELQTPFLILHGEHDPVPPDGSREWAGILPNSELVIWDHISHMPWLDDPDTFFPAVLEYLARP